MSRLEEITPGAAIKGILPDALVSVINAQWFGSEALELTYKDPIGRVGNHRVHYLRQPFKREPDFGVTSVNYNFAELLARAVDPS